jgi:hypothetical protein
MAIRTFTQPSAVLDRQVVAVNGGMASTKEAGTTFAYQDDLPKLPIPDLESTCQKYLDSLGPLQTPKEHHETRIAVREFLRYQGPDLQEKLKKYAQGKSNYIEQFCKCFRSRDNADRQGTIHTSTLTIPLSST